MKVVPDVGTTASVTRTLAGPDIASIAELSCDHNPLHFDEAYARSTFFGQPIAHGMAGALLLSGALTELMGPGNMWLSADFAFEKPAFVGDTLTATLVVRGVERRRIAEIDAVVTNQNDEAVLKGKLRSMLAGRPAASSENAS